MTPKASKGNIPENDWMLLWKMAYARESFRHVETTCGYIIENRIDRYAPIYPPLCTAICVSYVRPFTSGHIVGSLSEDIVPIESHHLHDQLKSLRHQVAAHSDADADSYGPEGPPLNNVRVIIRDDGQRSLGTFEVKFKPEAIELIQSLAGLLIEKTSYHVDKVWKRMRRITPVFPGEYLLDVKAQNFPRVTQVSGEQIIF